jgi:biopolymer transport protein ExbD
MAASQNSDDGEISGINVTPLVDIMLVLLIIFMVTAKYIEHEAIPVDLPKAANGGQITAKTLAVVVTKQGKMYVDGVEMPDAALVSAIESGKYGKKEDLQVIIGADKEAMHGAVIHLLDLLKQNDVSKFAFEIDKPT